MKELGVGHMFSKLPLMILMIVPLLFSFKVGAQETDASPATIESVSVTPASLNAITPSAPTADSPQAQAAAITAPVTGGKRSPYENVNQAKILDALETEEKSGVTSAPTEQRRPASAPAVKAQPVAKNVNLVSHTPTTRFLYFRLADSIVRFHVDANLGDRELETILKALGSTCVKAAELDVSCDSDRRNSMTVDKAFFANVKLSQVQEWSKSASPSGSLWKLTCASGEDDCFAPNTRIRKFRLTANRAATAGNRILAHGFESRATGMTAVKHRQPASVAPAKMIDKVYVTRTSSEVSPLLPKGSL